jgi:hypothetical protein
MTERKPIRKSRLIKSRGDSGRKERDLVYSTYLGGSRWDYADAIAVDPSGSAYVTGNTNSNDFPVTSGAYQTLCSPSPSTPRARSPEHPAASAKARHL